jgi:lysophospholipase L1-like esterase
LFLLPNMLDPSSRFPALYAHRAGQGQEGALRDGCRKVRLAPMPVLLTFGDSNTHGTRPLVTPGVFERHAPADRWPHVAAAALGPGWTLCPEGLPGRTTAFDDPVTGAHLNGLTGLRIALLTHAPIDVLTVMLGTNDCKTRFGAAPEAIAAGLAALLDLALLPDLQARSGGFRILVIAPPPVVEAGILAAQFQGGAAKARALAPLYAAVAAARGAAFLDAAAHAAVSPIDGVHLEAPAHHALGAAVAAAVRRLHP